MNNHCQFLERSKGRNVGVILASMIFFQSCKSEFILTKLPDYQLSYKFSEQIEREAQQDTLPWRYQISASEFALKGDYRGALTHWDLAFPGREVNYSKQKTDSLRAVYSPVKAKDYILKQAESHRVIIINEAHQNSFHRAFTRSLLQDLFNLGYTNLGLEALNNGADRDSLLHERNYPIKDTGYYIQDPQFGNLVRDALEIGFHLFAYEATGGEDGKFREISQAKNIQAMLEARPKEKFLIHVGFDHALEGIHNSWEKAMAARLTEYTGIDPLTVDQVMYSEKGNFDWSHPLLKAMEISQSTVLIGKDGIPLGYRRGEAYTDLAVLHPKSAFLAERPAWIFDGQYKEVEVLIPWKISEYPQMVLAYKKGEDINTAIPLDIVEIDQESRKIILALKSGEYQLVVTDGRESFTVDYSVD